MTDKNRKLWLDTRGVPVITTTKNGETNAIRWGWTEAKAVAADALAARVPAQGEPNDDREVLAYALFRHADMTREWRNFGEHVRKHWLEYADAVIELGFSRATVPDATTERYKDAAEGNRIRLVHAQNDAERFEAERDAALAAVERGRAIHYKREIWTGGGRSYWGCDIDKGSWPCPTIAALDGAPEPEVKP